MVNRLQYPLGIVKHVIYCILHHRRIFIVELKLVKQWLFEGHASGLYFHLVIVKQMMTDGVIRVDYLPVQLC